MTRLALDLFPQIAEVEIVDRVGRGIFGIKIRLVKKAWLALGILHAWVARELKKAIEERKPMGTECAWVKWA
jgi:hypothetical protein